jgi:hypothetical protein
LTAASNLIPRKAWMGAGFIAASLLGSLAGQPAGAFQATFNMQVASTPSLPSALATSRTFAFGGNSDLYTEMTVGSLTSLNGGTSLGVSTSPSLGLCLIRYGCPRTGADQTEAATFSFSKPVELGLYNNFKVGFNSRFNSDPNAVWSSDLGLALFYNGIQQGSTISLNNPILAGGSSFKFDSKVLVAANTAITVGLVCSGENCSIEGDEIFHISDVIVEVPAPLPLIGTGAAFAWTRRLRRRIKATPRPIMNG